MGMVALQISTAPSFAANFGGSILKLRISQPQQTISSFTLHATLSIQTIRAEASHPCRGSSRRL